jgi:hypothetical protein
MIVPIFPTRCECGDAFSYVRAEHAPSSYVFTCRNDSCAHRGKYFEIPHIEVREHVTAALLKPKLKVV